MINKTFPAQAFVEWIERNQLTQREVSIILGCSNSAVVTWKRNGAPFYIGLACAAIDANLEPPEATTAGSRRRT